MKKPHAHHRYAQLAMLTFTAWMSLGLSSCSLLPFSSDEKKEKSHIEQDPNKPEELNPLLPSGGDVAGDNYNVTTPEELAQIDNGAEGEVFFTNPDDPDEEIGAINQAFENQRNGQQWIPQYMRGLSFSRSKGLPIIIWFHDSAISPKSKALGRELLNTQKFLDWCKDKAICICLDTGAGMNGDDSTQSARDSARYIANLQRRYHISNKPAIVVLNAKGKTVYTADGFDGYLAGLALEIKKAVKTALKQTEEDKKQLSKQGYRNWTSGDGQYKIFAKVTRFDQKNDTLYLKDYTGRLKRIHESKFSNEDIDYIESNLRQAH